MIRVGIVLPVTDELPAKVGAYAAAGFESVACSIWEHPVVDDLAATLSQTRDAVARHGMVLSALSVYGNPLGTDETGASVRTLWRTLVSEAPRLGIPLVTGFAGRVPGFSVEASLPAWREFFAPLSDLALKHGLRLAFENCRLGDTWKTGKWNIAISPDAWELMFRTLEAPHLGLEWEPCHQLELLADPLAQLQTWAPRVFHVHGKDARLDRELLASRGFYAKTKWHRSVLPGQGDSDWGLLIDALTASSYAGTIDLENPEGDGPTSEEPGDSERKSLSYIKLARQRITT